MGISGMIFQVFMGTKCTQYIFFILVMPQRDHCHLAYAREDIHVLTLSVILYLPVLCSRLWDWLCRWPGVVSVDCTTSFDNAGAKWLAATPRHYHRGVGHMLPNTVLNITGGRKALRGSTNKVSIRGWGMSNHDCYQWSQTDVVNALHVGYAQCLDTYIDELSCGCHVTIFFFFNRKWERIFTM